MFFIWLLIYGSMTFLSRYLAQWSPWAISGGLFVSTATLVGWLLFRKLHKQVGLQFFEDSHWKHNLLFLPYLLPVIYNLLCADGVFPPLADIFTICLAAALEELIFRGLLLQFLRRWGDLLAIIFSAILFAAAHLLNAGDIDPYQIIFALVAGFAFAGLTLACKSLLPAMGIHLLINLTASGNDLAYLWFFILCNIVYLICGIRSAYNIKNPAEKECSYESIH